MSFSGGDLGAVDHADEAGPLADILVLESSHADAAVVVVFAVVLESSGLGRESGKQRVVLAVRSTPGAVYEMKKCLARTMIIW